MAKSSISLFSRLYLSILVTIIISVVLTRGIVEFIYKESDFKGFLLESQHIHAELTEQLNQKPLIAKSLKVDLPLGLDYAAELVQLKPNQQLCDDCELLKTSDDINYYAADDMEFVAEYKTAYSPLTLVIYHLTEEQRAAAFGEYELDLDDHNFDEVLFTMTILAFSIFVGITVYMPMRKLQTQIRQLVSTHNQFGSGNLDVTANTNIQQPLNELANSFNKMAAAINESVKERDTFAQAIPHEIRTPLSRIQLATGLIRKKSNDKDIHQLVNDTDEYVTDINQLINQIVQFSRVNTDKQDASCDAIQTVEINSFIQSRVDDLLSQSKHTVTVSVASTLNIHCNPIHLRLLIDNLLKNAQTFATSKIQIEANKKDGQLYISVEEDGPGISDENKETVFIPFARLDKSRSRKTGGLGLGLPIAKAAARKMSGTLQLSDSPLGGAKFILKIKRL